MKALFARYGGHGVIIGKGKEGVIDLPEDQSLDNMLDHHSVEILPNIRYISSYETFPGYMGAYPKLARNLVRIGTLSHNFMDVFLPYNVQVQTAIYVGKDKYQNVCSLFISTDFSHLDWILGDVEKSYDYVLTVWFRDKEEGEDNLRLHPELMEFMIVLLAKTMGLEYSEPEFTPSRTYLGKRIRTAFSDQLNGLMKNGAKDEELLEALKEMLNLKRNE